MQNLLNHHLDPVILEGDNSGDDYEKLTIESHSCAQALNYILSQHVVPDFSKFMYQAVDKQIQKEEATGFLYSQIVDMKVCDYFFQTLRTSSFRNDDEEEEK